ncbi:phytoene desaturase family protein [Thermodesulfobacteriota bacterium]
MDKWDTIIIGAGLSGLSLGAILAEEGKKVLVLEKAPHLGGRSETIEYKDHILDNGAHVPSRAGHLERVFEYIGEPYPELIPFGKGQIYHQGQWKLVRDLVPREELQEAFEIIRTMDRDKIRQLNDVPLDAWVSQFARSENMHLVFYFLATPCLVGNSYPNYSTGQLLQMLREPMDQGKRLTELAGIVPGGIRSIYQPMADAIKARGGEIRLNTQVMNVLFQKGRVKGVAVEEGTRAFYAEALKLEVLEADSVVCAFPLWDLLRILPTKDLPVWWIDWINYMKEKTSQSWSVVYGLDEPLFDMEYMRWVPQLPKSGLSGLFCHMPSYGDAVGQYQLHALYQGHYYEFPDLHNAHLGKNRIEIDRLLNLLEEETAEFFPEINEKAKWKIRHAGIYRIAEAPGLVGDKRPPIFVPSVDGLYLAGDCVSESVGMGMQSAAHSAIKCAEDILGKTISKA